MSDRIITERHIRSLKRHAKQRSRLDKNLSYMQHLDVVSEEIYGKKFRDIQANNQVNVAQALGPMSFYLQACQDAYFD